MSVLTGRYDFNRSDIRRKKNQSELAYAIECVMGRYLYKGREIEIAARKALKAIDNEPDSLREYTDLPEIYLDEPHGNGELALLLARLHPKNEVFVYTSSEDARAIIKTCTDGFTPNLHILDSKPQNI